MSEKLTPKEKRARAAYLRYFELRKNWDGSTKDFNILLDALKLYIETADLYLEDE